MRAIIDTSALISLYELGLVDKLSLFFSQVLVPEMVEKEFCKGAGGQPECTENRLMFLQQMYYTTGWFKQCKEYDSEVLNLFIHFQRLDPGEAEVFAQNQHHNNDYVMIIDENHARKHAEYLGLKKRGFLSLLAELDIKHNACNYFESIQLLKSSIRNLHAGTKLVQEVYDGVKNRY